MPPDGSIRIGANDASATNHFNGRPGRDRAAAGMLDAMEARRK